jgi:hypothetical protein
VGGEYLEGGRGELAGLGEVGFLSWPTYLIDEGVLHTLKSCIPIHASSS